MKKLTTSKNANTNYLAKIVELKGIVKHPNADKLQLCQVDYQQVILGENAKDGDIMVFFPLECQINEEFLGFTNSFRHPNLNKDKEQVGFFDDNGRVRAVKLRGERSMGYCVPLKELLEFIGEPIEYELNQSFDSIDDYLLVKKYRVYRPEEFVRGKNGKVIKRISRLVDGQVHLHVDTDNLRKEVGRLELDDEISITYKVHGTSWWVSNVLGNRKLSLLERVAKIFGVKIKETEYDYFYGSRKVIKNQYETQNKQDYYGYDLWGKIKEDIKDKLPKGYTVYGECVGYTENGAYIQKPYDYGCEQGKNRLYIYRVTFTNEDGVVFNLSTKETLDFCNRVGLEYVPLFFRGTVRELWTGESDNWRADLIKYLETAYCDHDCYICKNKVPEEGIVIRMEKYNEFEAYKLKSFRFLEFETKQLDAGDVDLESIN